MTDRARWGGAALAAVLLFSFLCFSFPFDQAGYDQSDELFYLAGGLTTSETGNFVVPSYQGHVRMQKPPMNYWLIALSYRAFGVGAWQGRLPGVLASVGAVALTAWLGFLLFRSRRSSLYGAAILVGCHLFLDQAHSATTDAVLSLFVLLSFCGFAAALFEERRWGLPLAWAAMGAAMLQKGPVWAFIPLATVCAWMFVAGRRSGLGWRRVFAPLPIALFLAVVLPWPLLLLHRLSEGQVVPTMAQELTEHLVPMPLEMATGFLNTLVRLSAGMLPWWLLGFFYLRPEARSPKAALLALWGLGFTFLFGLLLVHQRSRYLVPLTPPLALLCGHALPEFQSEAGRRTLAWKLFAAVADLSFVGLALYSATLVAAGAQIVKTPAAVAVGVWSVALSLAFLAAVWLLRRRAPDGVAWVLAAAFGLATVQTVCQFSWDAAYLGSPAYTLAKEHVRGAPAAAALAGVGLDRGERAWAWLGAGRSFPHFGSEPGEAGVLPVDWAKISTSAYLLMPEAERAAMPADVRARYAEVASLSGPYRELRAFWFLERPKIEARWSLPWRKLLLLKRISSVPYVP